MSETFDPDLAARFSAAPYPPGTRFVCGSRDHAGIVIHVEPATDWRAHSHLVRVHHVPTGECLGQTRVPTYHFVHDYTDPGTQGHLLAALKAAWGAMSASLIEPLRWQVGEAPLWQVVIERGGDSEDAGEVVEFEGPSAGDVLAQAWEARPQ